MTEREYGQLFDEIAEDYERARPGYPAALVDTACLAAGLSPDSRVLEVGCGTGKLTAALAERALRVDAVDPGARLVEVARRLVGTAPVQFHIGRFEDVELPDGAFDAAFSATAFHWVDPSIGWSKVARLLRPGGLFALVGHALGGVRNDLDDEFRAVWCEVLPEAESWWRRDPYTLWDGVHSRSGNLSEVWAWLMDRDLGSPDAGDLFTETEILTVPVSRAQTTDELLAVIRTTSAYLRLDSDARVTVERRFADVLERNGGVCRNVELALLVMARTRL